MAIDRRTVLRGVAAGLVHGTLAPSTAVSETRARLAIAAARRTMEGSYGLAIVTPDGRELRSVALPGRGHDIAECSATRRIVVFARRPGRFSTVLDLRRAGRPQSFEAPPDRHFYGHGVFARDGRLLLTTENDFENGRGVIGVWDAAHRIRRIGELPSHGIGPHDIALLPDARTIVVANGGVREHPDIGGGRRVLNPHAIETSLAYVDLATGDLLERHELPHAAGLSLRHLAIGDSGTVVIGAQEQSPSAGARGVVLTHQRQRQLVEVSCGEGDPLGGYVSSVATDASGTVAAVTSSRTGTALLFEIATGKVVGRSRLPDVSGVAQGPAPRAFVLTSGTGAIALAGEHVGQDARTASLPCAWDNHAVAISLG